MRRIRLTPVLVSFWLVLLAVTVVVAARSSYRQSLRTEEYAYACDPFGYLRMAKEIRKAADRRELPQFRLESQQTRLLINFMQSRNVPVPLWDEVVAPHAHHYFPASGFVGVQYPPGTGLTLAIYPEGKAVYSLNLTVVLVFLVTGILALVIAAYKQAWASAGFIVLPIYLGLAILGRMGALSFSINAVLVPILLSCALALISLKLRVDNRHRLALISALGAGLFLGFATLIRLPAVLLTPGFLILLWPNSWRAGIRSLPAVFLLGVILTGVLPVLAYQQAIAGAWYLPTYANVDAALPTLESLRNNVSYFLGKGDGAKDNWALVYALAGFGGFALATHLSRRSKSSNRLGLSCRRLGVAAVIVWALPTVFFLTHKITAPYYAIPGIFGAIALAAFGSLAIEVTQDNYSKQFDKRKALWWLALALLIWPGIATSNRAWRGRSRTPAPAQAIAHDPIVLPSELADDHAWVWADLLTGSFWYYADKPAFKIQFTNSETRAMIFKFVSDRGERQYLIQDNERMQQFMDEIIQWGGTLEPRGKVDGQPYFLIRWPQGGPLATNVASTN